MSDGNNQLLNKNNKIHQTPISHFNCMKATSLRINYCVQRRDRVKKFKRVLLRHHVKMPTFRNFIWLGA